MNQKLSNRNECGDCECYSSVGVALIEGYCINEDSCKYQKKVRGDLLACNKFKEIK